MLVLVVALCSQVVLVLVVVLCSHVLWITKSFCFRSEALCFVSPRASFTHTHFYTHTHTHTFTHKNTHTHNTHTHTQTHTHIYAHIFATHMRNHMHLHLELCTLGSDHILNYINIPNNKLPPPPCMYAVLQLG